MPTGFQSIPDKERQIESFLQLWMRKFLPTLDRRLQWPGSMSTPPVEMPTILLYPTNQGSRMPQADPNELSRRSRTGGPGGPA
jgi:hypothetical protein